MKKIATAAVILIACLMSGCTSVYIPKSDKPMTVNIIVVQNIAAWRSAQGGFSTNVSAMIEGGGKPELTIPLTGK
ncbi:MAG: hypothetical protein ACOYOU_16340 [Kiritimatiellia bacterium]